MDEKIIVTKSDYIASAVGKKQYPEEKLPEIVFIGRSNVGKSSLINSLTCRKNLARTSQTPGKTRTINFYKVELKISEENSATYKNFYLVDLPGYGYAKTSKTNRRIWEKFIEEYLLNSREIKFVCQLIDLRHDPMESDLKMFHWLIEKNIPVLVIATKSDKLGKNDQKKNFAAMKKILEIEELSILPYSSVKNEGRAELLDVILNSL
ncbi:MAG: YihA family ribosome biogenesis GTP-binding protein [Selenomonadaceae bacterium]|nr:YihA family ribosome biogenesis GTP-binding protein [Selenomonadaceae bacterium]